MRTMSAEKTGSTVASIVESQPSVLGASDAAIEDAPDTVPSTDLGTTRRRLIVFSLCLALFLSALDVTIVATAASSVLMGTNLSLGSGLLVLRAWVGILTGYSQFERISSRLIESGCDLGLVSDHDARGRQHVNTPT